MFAIVRPTARLFMNWSDVGRSSHLAGDACAASRRPSRRHPASRASQGPMWVAGSFFLQSQSFLQSSNFFPARHLPTYTWRACSSQNTLIDPFACTLLAPWAKPAKIQPSASRSKAAAKAAAAIACDQTSVASLDLFHHHRLTKHTFLYASTWLS
jgi:hypothetical protein